ncbi:DUF4037 domain-containing protein [Pseudalkalibacillus caeni]|uniref:DUF4037 domain-containing protein n=1 Tax=Exobacillus caeni TaxID=2574798 RepID=A0A5R9EXN3_9BACL|nr:DUF4037 domain-containing protein [Pseudalkalibacillus caeni]TLS35857.1 DUF4037 domain-containing protein [Pseudalkalibacillus caeni]
MDLYSKAVEMAKKYKQNNKVEAILLAGSVSRGWQDQHSDIELHILWKEPPSEIERKNPIDKSGGNILDFYPYEDEEWSETFLVEGVKFEISNFLTETVARFVRQVVDHHQTDYDLQCIAASVFYGKCLHGESVINQLKSKVMIYPQKLSENMILEHLELSGRWNNRLALVDRKDWLMLYEIVCDTQRKVLGALFGINKMYVHHPAFKWLDHVVQCMEVKPRDLYNRLSGVLLDGDPKKGILELEEIIQEVFELAEEKFPSLNIDELKKRADFVRPEHC